MSEFVVDLANEAAIVIVALRQPTLAVSLLRRVRPDNFLDGQHTIIWQALGDLLVAGKRRRLDITTIARAVGRRGGGQEVVDYVRDLMEDESRIADYRENVDTLLWDSVRFRLDRDVVPEFSKTVRDADASPASLRSMARRILEMTSSRPGSNVVEMSRVREDFDLEMEDRARAPGVFGLGYPEFDDLLGEGFAPRKTSILAGLSSSGKSMVALNWAMRIANQGRKVAYCCYELDHVSALKIVVSSHTGIDYEKICTGRLAESERQIVRAAAHVWSSRITFIENPFLAPDHSRSGERRTNADNVNTILSDVVDSGADVVFYDLFDRSYVSERPNDVKSALKAIQEGHKEISVHGCLLHQINLKDVERRRDKRPTRDALEGIGVYVQIADLLLLLHRPGMWVPGYENDLFVICEKQRVGRWPWTSHWTWEGHIQRVSDPKIVVEDSDEEEMTLDDIRV